MKGLMVCPKAKTCRKWFRNECSCRKPHQYTRYCKGSDLNCKVVCVPVKPVKQEKRWKGKIELIYGGVGKWGLSVYSFKTRKQAREMKRKIEGILKKGED